MAANTMIDQVRKGMEVVCSDGVALGKVAEVWYGSDPDSNSAYCDDDVCSRVQVQHKGGALYVPYSALANVGGNRLTLKVDAAKANAMPWRHKPAWL